MKVLAALALLTAVLLLNSCSRQSTDNAASAGYTPVFAVPATPASGARGTMQGDYDFAASSKSLREAAQRWDEFLTRHVPANGEYNDAFHKQHVDAARYELMRISYLLGDRDKGDRLLKELDPFQSR